MTINEFMTHDHRKCDEEFVLAEQAIEKKAKDAKELFDKFAQVTQRHFRMEEEVMFAEYNAKAGGGMNPTMVMLGEHEQMRAIMKQISDNLEQSNFEKALSMCDSLMFVIQQHNMKEEQMMYNLADRVLDSKAIIEAMVEVV